MPWPWPEPRRPVSHLVQQSGRWPLCWQTFLRRVISVPLFRKRWTCRGAGWRGGDDGAGLAPGQPLAGPPHRCRCRKPGLRTRPCLPRGRREFQKTDFVCIAPNHVLLLTDFGCSRISSSLAHVQIPLAFPGRSAGGRLVHFSAGRGGSWGLVRNVTRFARPHSNCNVHCD